MLKQKKFSDRYTFFFASFFLVIFFVLIAFFIFFILEIVQRPSNTKRKLYFKKYVSLGVKSETDAFIFTEQKKLPVSKKNSIVEGNDISERYIDYLFEEYFAEKQFFLVKQPIQKDKKEKKKTIGKEISKKNISRRQEKEELKDSIKISKDRENKKIAECQKDKDIVSKQTSCYEEHKEKNGIIANKSQESKPVLSSLPLSSSSKKNENDLFFLDEKEAQELGFLEINAHYSNGDEKSENKDEIFLLEQEYKEELQAYVIRALKHIRQFPGRKYAVEIMLKTKKNFIEDIVFLTELKSVAYKNYIMQLFSKIEIPKQLWNQEIHIIL